MWPSAQGPQEPGPPAVRVSIKIEAVANEEAEGLTQDAEHVTQDAAGIKREPAWELSAGLYADHDVKEELVLGPECLQRSGIAQSIDGAALAATRAAAGTAGVEQEYKSSINRNIVEINTYMCDICGKLFKYKNKLIGHIKMHLQEKPVERSGNDHKAFFCRICKKKFRQACHLKRHEQTHSRAKPHACEICGKDFARLDSLKLHRIIHTGRKPYSCETCYKQFTQLCNLTRHTRIHTGEKPYPCGICLKRFTQSCDLKKHVRIHTGNKPYSCEICSKLFTCSGDLRKHNRTAGHKRAVRTFSRRKK